MKIQPKYVWDDIKGRKKKWGVTPAELAKWEATNGVKLPKILRDALQVQNGGKIRYCDVVIYPLKDFFTLDEEFWELADKEYFPKTNLAFVFGENEKSGTPCYLLNFNANGPRGEPAVFHHYNDWQFHSDADTVETFFAELLKVESAPAVNWLEADKLDVELFRETTTMGFGDSQFKVECVVGKRGGKLLVYRHESIKQSEAYVKVQLATPLDPTKARIQTIPSAPPIYALSLRSKDRDKSVKIESHRMPDDVWKNQELGALNDIQSVSKERLIELRRQLLGRKTAAKAEAFDLEMQQWAILGQQVQAMPKVQRKAINESLANVFLKSANEVLEGKDVDFDTLGKSSLNLLHKAVNARKDQRK